MIDTAQFTKSSFRTREPDLDYFECNRLTPVAPPTDRPTFPAVTFRQCAIRGFHMAIGADEVVAYVSPAPGFDPVKVKKLVAFGAVDPKLAKPAPTPTPGPELVVPKRSAKSVDAISLEAIPEAEPERIWTPLILNRAVSVGGLPFAAGTVVASFTPAGVLASEQVARLFELRCLKLMPNLSQVLTV